ncbi:MAG TPA: outer membrane protein assembly factor BamE [bacterium]|nr:outer membrane protein assembly factor BamE [bacterium]
MKMRPYLHWSGLLALALPLIVAGCISIGAEFRPQAVELVKPGQTTDQEVLKIFGNPVRTGVADDGSREWTYAYYKASAFGSFEGRDLIIKFDDNGKVKSFSYHTTDPKENIVQPK